MADKLWRVRVETDGYHFAPPYYDRRQQRHVNDDAEFKAHARSLIGKDCQVMLREEPRQRSVDQNAYLHAETFPKVARAMNVNIDEAKLMLMGEQFGWHWNKTVGRYCPVKPRTSSMTIKQTSEFIPWAVEYAAQMPEPAIILLPNESLWDE